MPRLTATMLLLACVGATPAAGPPDAAVRERFEKIEAVGRLYLRGDGLYRAGKIAEATKVFEKMLEMREGLYPSASHPQGHPDLARSLSNLAELYRARGDYAKSEPLNRRALEMYEGLYPRALYPRGHPSLANSLNNTAVLHLSRGKYATAEPFFVRALEMREGLYPRARYPRGHPELAQSLSSLGFLHQARGDYAKAAPLYHRAVEVNEALYPKAGYPKGHPDLAGSLGDLAELHRSQGDYAKAEPLHRRALAMNEGLYPWHRYPQGHSALARSLNNLALLHQARGDYAKAQPLFERALEMRVALHPAARYPQGHPDLARSLNNLAALYRARGDYGKAEPLFRRTLAMEEGLYPRSHYPQGHPAVAQSLNNLSALHFSRGDYAKAEPLVRRATEMSERLYPEARYPQGHPELAQNLKNMAALHHARGEYAKAEPLARRAVRMYSDSARSLAASAPEATALNYLASQPLTRDIYLSVTTHLPESDAYPALWQTKAALARVAERRHLAVLAASSKEARELWDAVLSLKRERGRLLLAPAGVANARARDERLDGIDEAIRKKEAALLPLLPALKHSDGLAKATPADLRKALPADVAFVDLLRYTRSEHDPEVKGEKGEKHTPHYVAFVVTRGATVRVELGEASPIEGTLVLWRRAVVEGSASESKYAAEAHRLLWSPLLKRLPAKASAVFVSPDAALNGVPWAALRDAKTGRILLEEYAVAAVPHGPMLLDRLTGEKRKPGGKPTLLAMGGVAYDKKPGSSALLAMRGPAGEGVVWAPLAGTAKELRQVVALAGGRKVVRLDGNAADASALLDALPRAQFAHLATHGFFADAKFRTAFQLDPRLFDRGVIGERVGAGSRSPMVLSGLVCAGANLTGTPNRGVVTADAIVGLDLRKLDLAVLSACETGLGDVAGGEGVYGLVRAFHVAGARNVVASLWKVDDEATAALMALFYRNLWGKEKVSPAEALRRAQLAVYREPGRVTEWAAGRGPLPRPVAGSEKPPEKGPKAKTSPARAWAAFVLSGPGN